MPLPFVCPVWLLANRLQMADNYVRDCLVPSRDADLGATLAIFTTLEKALAYIPDWQTDHVPVQVKTEDELLHVLRGSYRNGLTLFVVDPEDPARGSRSLHELFDVLNR